MDAVELLNTFLLPQLSEIVSAYMAFAGVTSQVISGTSKVTTLTTLPNRLAAGFANNTIRVWDLSDDQVVQTPMTPQVLRGHTGWIGALVGLSDGRLASGSDDTTVRIWNLTNGTAEILTNPDIIYALIVVPGITGDRLVLACADMTVRVWDLSLKIDHSLNNTPTQILRGHTRQLLSLVALPGQNSVASGSYDTTIRIWNLADGSSRVLESHTQSVCALAVLTDENGVANRIVSGSNDATIRIWDLIDGSVQVLIGSSTGVISLAVLSPYRLFGGYVDGTIWVWDIRRNIITFKQILQGHDDWATALIVLPNGNLVSGSDDATIRIWE